MDYHTILAVLLSSAGTLVAVLVANKAGWLGQAEAAVQAFELKSEADALHLVARAITFLGSTKQFDDAIAQAQQTIAANTAAKAARAQMTQQVMVLMAGVAQPTAPAPVTPAAP